MYKAHLCHLCLWVTLQSHSESLTPHTTPGAKSHQTVHGRRRKIRKPMDSPHHFCISQIIKLGAQISQETPSGIAKDSLISHPTEAIIREKANPNSDIYTYWIWSLWKRGNINVQRRKLHRSSIRYLQQGKSYHLKQWEADICSIQCSSWKKREKALSNPSRLTWWFSCF